MGKKAKLAYDEAAATLKKASAQKKLVDSKLNAGQSSAKQADVLAAKTASDASKLQEKAIAAARSAKKATETFNKDAKQAAGFAHKARQSKNGMEEDERELNLMEAEDGGIGDEQ